MLESRISGSNECTEQSLPALRMKPETDLADFWCGCSRDRCCARASLVRRLQRQSAVDANDPDRCLLPWFYLECARTHRSSVADDDQSPRRIARRRLLDPRARRAAKTMRWERSCSKSIRLAKPCACNASAPLKQPRCCARSWREIDVAVFTFDPERRLRLVNRAGEILLGQPIDKLLGQQRKRSRARRLLDVDEDAPLTLSVSRRVRAMGRSPKHLSRTAVCRTSCWC